MPQAPSSDFFFWPLQDDTDARSTAANSARTLLGARVGMRYPAPPLLYLSMNTKRTACPARDECSGATAGDPEEYRGFRV